MNLEKIFLYILFIISPQLLVAQELIYDQYTTDDGLPSNTIYEIVQDSNGLIWMGTENGLVSYDGVSFKRFSDSRLNDNDILKLEISKDGHVTFCNTSNQYCRLEGNKVKVIEVNFNGFFDLRSTKSDDFIIAFNGGLANNLSKYQDSLISIDLGNFYGINFDGRNNYTAYYISEFVDTIKSAKISVTSYCLLAFETLNLYGASKFSVDDQFYIARERRVWNVDSTLSTNLELNFTYLFRDKNKEYVTTMEGLLIYNNKTNTIYKKMENFEIGYGFIDNENNLWLSTINDGLLKIINDDYNILPRRGIGKDIRDVKIFSDKILSFSFSNLSIYDYNFDLIKNIPFEFDQFKNLASFDNEIYVFDAENIRRFNADGNETSNAKMDILQKVVMHLENKMYIANKNGLYIANKEILLKEDDKIEKVLNLSGINVIEGTYFCSTIYLGTDNGLYQFDKYTHPVESLKYSLASKNIRSLFLNQDKTLWIGTSNDGLYSLDMDGGLDSIDIKSCVGSNVINDIVQFENYLFVATSAGLARYDLNTKDCRVLNEYRGLLTNSIRKILVKSLDSIFVTQNKELIMIDNSLFDKEMNSPRLILENIYINNTSYKSEEEKLVFNYDDNNVEFQFDYYTYRKVGRKMLQYKFGLDSTWTTSNDLNLRFPSLEPNTYTLDVRGLFANTEHTETSSYEFTIRSPWWQTLWARVIGLFALVFSIYLYISRRSRRVKEREDLKIENLKEIEEAKRENLKRLEVSKREYLQQINKIKDQALQLQMNPHFIFNAMNAIQNFITSDREKDATIYLAKFAKLIRLIFEYSNAALISMEAELDFVRLYIDLEQLRFQDRITCILDISESIQSEKDILKVPPLLIQPIIENSFKHGLFHKLSGGEIKILYDLRGDTIITVVEDNGIGREASRHLKEGRLNEDRYSGLKNIMERLEIFSFNNLEQENSLLIEDLYEDGKPSGTRTTLKVTLDVNKENFQ